MRALETVRQSMQRDQVFDFMLPTTGLEVDVSHGTALYLEDVSVSFDGFKAINDLNRDHSAQNVDMRLLNRSLPISVLCLKAQGSCSFIFFFPSSFSFFFNQCLASSQVLNL